MRTLTKPVSGSAVALFLSLIVPTFTYTYSVWSLPVLLGPERCPHKKGEKKQTLGNTLLKIY